MGELNLPPHVLRSFNSDAYRSLDLLRITLCCFVSIRTNIRRGEFRSANICSPTLPGVLLAITNVDTLIENYNKTQLGKLTADPVMEPFTKDVRRQFENRWSAVHYRLGLTLDDLKDVPGGEACVALIEPAENASALAIVVDVTGRLPQANDLLERVIA